MNNLEKFNRDILERNYLKEVMRANNLEMQLSEAKSEIIRLKSDWVWEELVKQKDINEKLNNSVEKLSNFIRRHYSSHRECEDSWYSCPADPSYSGNDDSHECDCGYDDAHKLLESDIDEEDTIEIIPYTEPTSDGIGKV